MNRNTTIGIVSFIGLALLLASSSGCAVSIGPTLGAMSYPIPVSPYWQKQFEDEYHNQERYARAPVLGPLQPGAPTEALDPPSEDEVMRALEEARSVQGGLPLFHEVQRNNVRVVVEPIADYIDPPRVYPLVGPAQLHHAQYKCIVYYTETTRVGWPIRTPSRTKTLKKSSISTTTTSTWSATSIPGRAPAIRNSRRRRKNKHPVRNNRSTPEVRKDAAAGVAAFHEEKAKRSCEREVFSFRS